MGLNLLTYKTMGAIYDIEETQHTAKGFPKRHIYLEIPKTLGDTQKTEVIKFLVLGDECGSLDWYKKGEWVAMLFSLSGRFWKKPETGENILLQSLKVVDISRIENPIKTGEVVADSPDDLSPDPLAELAKGVKDYTRVVDEQQLPFDSGDGTDDLPF